MHSVRWNRDVCTECFTFLSLITGFLGRSTISIRGNHVLYHAVTQPQQRYRNDCPPEALMITLAHANAFSHMWCYETLPQKVTHLSPIAFHAGTSNGRNFLGNWSHGVKCHVWPWRNVAHISISPSTGRLKQHNISSGGREDGLPNTRQAGWVAKVHWGVIPTWSKAACKSVSGGHVSVQGNGSWRKPAVLFCHVLIYNQHTAKYIYTSHKPLQPFHVKPSPLELSI